MNDWFLYGYLVVLAFVTGRVWGRGGWNMIAAIYARKSTEQNDVGDEEKSVSRQTALGRAFATEKSWTVIEEYVDDGISGRETAKLVNRARMLADATAGKFQAVIVRDYDRISRDDREGPSFVYMLHDAGVTVWEYATRAQIKVDRALDRTLLNLKAGFSAHETEAAAREKDGAGAARSSRGRTRLRLSKHRTSKGETPRDRP